MTVRARSVLAAAALVGASPAAAQVGVGVLLGSPTGLTAEVGVGAVSLTADAGLAGGGFGQAHVLVRNAAFRGELADLRLLVGPGVFYDAARSDRSAGVSVLVGLAAALPANVDVFAQVTPGLRLTQIDDVARIGAAVGLRYFP